MENFSKVVVTGGAGFIGSYLVDKLSSEELNIVVIDDLSAGSMENLRRHIGKPYFSFIKSDLKQLDDVWMEGFNNADVVYHLAANPEVKVSVINPEIHFNENVVTTFNVLEACRKNDIKYLIFASSSTIYGDAQKIPTPEDYYPLEPISVYGACKLACENLILAYSKLYGIRTLILRYANIIGPRSGHGVIIDFINKLRNNPRELEILGDGTQRKSYLHIEDAIAATIHLFKKFVNDGKEYDIYNVGNDDWVTVKEIADVVVEEMGLGKVSYVFKLGTKDGRGWPGDVKFMLLDISKLKNTGWRPRWNSKEAVRKTVKQILAKNH